MARAALATLALVALLGLCLAVSQEIDAVTRCKAIGLSSGCSGCNDATSDCQWCVNPFDHSMGECLPSKQCGLAKFNGQDYIDGKRFCAKLNYPHESEPHFGGAEATAEKSVLWNGAFDPYYCKFPHEPWIVDRTAKPTSRPATESCFSVNHKPLMERVALERCYAEKLEKPIYTLGKRDEECIRYYHSLICTAYCPEYGVGTDFQRVCSSYCDRLNQICPPKLKECLEEKVSIPITCTDKGDEDCDSPNLIPVSGRFDYEFCFNGDKSRCAERDCVVELASQLPDGLPFGSRGISAPCCHGVQTGCQGHAQCEDSAEYRPPKEATVSLAFDIVQPNKLGGRSCGDIAEQKAMNVLTMSRPVGAQCISDELGQLKQCFVTLTLREDSTTLPEYCDLDSPTQTCPTFLFKNFAQVSENQATTLSCPAGQMITAITFANYGRPQRHDDGHYVAAPCGNGQGLDWTDELEVRCIGQNPCEVVATNEVKGDPCLNFFKWLAVEYECGSLLL